MGFAITTFGTFNFLNKHKVLDSIVYIIQVVFPVLFVLVFLYVKNILYLREQEQQGKIQLAQLQQQFSYYQDKQRDEEKVRSIYHDMKNHLLVLEGSQGTDATRKMAEQLRSQIADFEDYVHTGNEFLDIIIKDKAAKARENGIDFSAVIQFEDGAFIEPLDISTIFGNALDNALEASVKLPPDERVVTVKAERIRDMLSIVFENKMDESQKFEGKTSKADAFMHGFGIKNVKRAVEKYDGQCSIRKRSGMFTMKMVLPLKGK